MHLHVKVFAQVIGGGTVLHDDATIEDNAQIPGNCVVYKDETVSADKAATMAEGDKVGTYHLF